MTQYLQHARIAETIEPLARSLEYDSVDHAQDDIDTLIQRRASRLLNFFWLSPPPNPPFE